MRILFLTQIVPYPPDAGPKVKTWHVLRYLSQQGHQIILGTFVRPEERPYLENLKTVCREVYSVPIRRSRAADVAYWVRSQFSGRPFLIERDDLAGMRELVGRILASGEIEAVHADQLSMAQFALDWKTNSNHSGGYPGMPSAPVRVFDAHNAVWTIMERMRQTAPWYLRPVLSLEARRTKRFEGRVLDQFEHILAVAEPDRLALLEAWESLGTDRQDHEPPITIVPIAIDAGQLQPVARQPGSQNIVTMGTLHYPPNADGIRWFAREVFPLVRQEVPGAKLTIIGKNPPADFLQLQEQHPQAVRVTGYVPDLVPYLEQAALMVVAVRAGGGMRVRILEAFSRGVPVITTTVGLEGIQAQAGRDVLVADGPKDFAGEVVRLLQDEQLQTALSMNGRQLVEHAYDWRVVLGKMDNIYPLPDRQEARERITV